MPPDANKLRLVGAVTALIGADAHLPSIFGENIAIDRAGIGMLDERSAALVLSRGGRGCAHAFALAFAPNFFGVTEEHPFSPIPTPDGCSQTCF